MKNVKRLIERFLFFDEKLKTDYLQTVEKFFVVEKRYKKIWKNGNVAVNLTLMVF